MLEGKHVKKVVQTESGDSDNLKQSPKRRRIEDHTDNSPRPHILPSSLALSYNDPNSVEMSDEKAQEEVNESDPSLLRNNDMSHF